MVAAEALEQKARERALRREERQRNRAERQQQHAWQLESEEEHEQDQLGNEPAEDEGGRAEGHDGALDAEMQSNEHQREKEHVQTPPPKKTKKDKKNREPLTPEKKQQLWVDKYFLFSLIII